MTAEVHIKSLGLETILDAKEDNLDITKLEQEFREGLGTVFAEIKDVELKSNEQISEMSAEEFFLELENLDKQYDSKIQLLIEKQIAKDKADKEIKKAKKEFNERQLVLKKEAEAKSKNVEERLKLLREDNSSYERVSKLNKIKNNIEVLELSLGKVKIGSGEHDSILISLQKAQQELEALDASS